MIIDIITSIMWEGEEYRVKGTVDVEPQMANTGDGDAKVWNEVVSVDIDEVQDADGHVVVPSIDMEDFIKAELSECA